MNLENRIQPGWVAEIDEKDLDQIYKYMKTNGCMLKTNQSSPTHILVAPGHYSLLNGYNVTREVIHSKEWFKEMIYKPLKESEGKLVYEIDWGFIKAIAERMATNKGKYPINNWKKPMTDSEVVKIKDAATRHIIEYLDGNYEDDGREYGHIEGIVCNLMIELYQLKNRK